MTMAQTIKARITSPPMSCLDLTIEAYGPLMVVFPTHLRKKGPVRLSRLVDTGGEGFQPPCASRASDFGQFWTTGQKVQAIRHWVQITECGKVHNRADLRASVFAFPRQHKEPLTDASHVRNALARFDQVEGVSDADCELAFANIKEAAYQREQLAR